MKFFILSLVLITFSAHAYVPTVESLFRHGANADVTSNALMVSAKVALVNPYAEKVEQVDGSALWVKWVYNITPQGKLKLTQLIYRAASMTEASLVDKSYVAELSPQAFDSSPEMGERGLFISLMNSLLINDGSFMVNFLHNRGVNVQLNENIINQDKKNLLARYRAWLIRTKGGRAAGAEPSPLAPTADRDKVDKIMAAPMYADTQQVVLSRYQGDPAWQIKGETFEAWVSDATREVRQLILRTGAAEVDIQCRDYLLYGGTHSFPRQIVVKGQQDQFWQIDIIGLKHFNETGAELLARLRRHDQVLMQRRETVARPAFLF